VVSKKEAHLPKLRNEDQNGCKSGPDPTVVKRLVALHQKTYSFALPCPADDAQTGQVVSLDA